MFEYKVFFGHTLHFISTEQEFMLTRLVVEVEDAVVRLQQVGV